MISFNHDNNTRNIHDLENKVIKKIRLQLNLQLFYNKNMICEKKTYEILTA